MAVVEVFSVTNTVVLLTETVTKLSNDVIVKILVDGVTTIVSVAEITTKFPVTAISKSTTSVSLIVVVPVVVVCTTGPWIKLVNTDTLVLVKVDLTVLTSVTRKDEVSVISEFSVENELGTVEVRVSVCVISEVEVLVNETEAVTVSVSVTGRNSIGVIVRSVVGVVTVVSVIESDFVLLIKVIEVMLIVDSTVCVVTSVEVSVSIFVNVSIIEEVKELVVVKIDSTNKTFVTACTGTGKESVIVSVRVLVDCSMMLGPCSTMTNVVSVLIPRSIVVTTPKVVVVVVPAIKMDVVREVVSDKVFVNTDEDVAVSVTVSVFVSRSVFVP